MKEIVHGSVAGTGAAINVKIGFKPTYVKLFNFSDAGKKYPIVEWFDGMTSGGGFKSVAPLDGALSSAGLAIGSSANTAIKISNTVTYKIGGILYTKTTAETAFTATTHDIAASEASVQEACYLVSLATNGDVTITMGDVATGAGNAVVPATPAGKCAIGYLRLEVAVGTTIFNASTDALSAGHLTDTYVNYADNAQVASILASGGISQYDGTLPFAALTGTVSGTAGLTALTGSSTLFTTELEVGDRISMGGVEGEVFTLTSATALVLKDGLSATVAASTPVKRINSYSEGFTISTDADLNASGETIYYIAIR